MKLSLPETVAEGTASWYFIAGPDCTVELRIKGVFVIGYFQIDTNEQPNYWLPSMMRA